ncbi:MAG: hypothetical protein KAW84_04810 [Thermoplasmata archaeon]|nr:hypothetical protein [Thermoplasmata archaeon]
MKDGILTFDDGLMNWAKRFWNLYGDLTIDDLTVGIAKPLAADVIEGLELIAPYLPESMPEIGPIDWKSEFRPFGNMLRVMFAPIWSELLLGRGLRIAEIQQVAAPELSIRHVRRIANESPIWPLHPDPSPPRYLPCRFGAHPRRVDGRHRYYRLGYDFDSCASTLFPFGMSQPLQVFCETFLEEMGGLDLSSAGNATVQILRAVMVNSSEDLADMIVDQADSLLSIPSRMRSLATDSEQLRAIRQVQRAHSEFREGIQEEMREQLIRGLGEGWNV